MYCVLNCIIFTFYAFPYRNSNAERISENEYFYYKTLKFYVEKFSKLIQKEKLRSCLLGGIDPVEIVVPFTNVEISSLWTENEYW